MLKKVLLTLVCGQVLFLSGCATTGMFTPVGYAIVHMAKSPMTATSAAGGSKHGKACAKNILGFFASGDSSVEAAKKAGGISTVSSVDTDNFNVLGFYGETCTIVTGN
jgi:hypothetical protein